MSNRKLDSFEMFLHKMNKFHKKNFCFALSKFNLNIFNLNMWYQFARKYLLSKFEYSLNQWIVTNYPVAHLALDNQWSSIT